MGGFPKLRPLSPRRYWRIDMLADPWPLSQERSIMTVDAIRQIRRLPHADSQHSKSKNIHSKSEQN